MTNEELFDWCSKQNCKLYSNCDLCMYDKGRADKYQEIVSEYMLLTEKQVAEIRADAIDELSKEMHYCLHCGMGKDKSLEHLINLAEKLKEQK